MIKNTQHLRLRLNPLFFTSLSQKHLVQLLWSSIFPRGPFRFNAPQFLIRLSLLVSNHQDLILHLLLLVPVPPLLELKHGEYWSL